MRRFRAFALVLAASCGEEPYVCTDCWVGGGQPGEALAEGGEIRHEHVRMHGQPAQTWIQLYQYKGPSASDNAPMPVPADGGKRPLGTCVDERDPATASWPYRPILGESYLELPKAELTGTGIAGALAIEKTTPPNQIGNSTFRTHDATYGGGTGGGGFNGTLTAEQSTPGGRYTLDIGISVPMEYYIPDDYTPPRGIGGADAVTIVGGKALELEWTAPVNDMGESGKERTRKTYYSYVLFADPSAAFPPQFLCFPETPGHLTVPAAVIDALPPTGLIVHAHITHYMEARDAGGEHRRFDLVGGVLHVSDYVKP